MSRAERSIRLPRCSLMTIADVDGLLVRRENLNGNRPMIVLSTIFDGIRTAEIILSISDATALAAGLAELTVSDGGDDTGPMGMGMVPE